MAPSSGAGKTTVTLGLLRAFRRNNTSVRAAKSGPDYIDPAFHAAACGTPSVNLDAWAMDEGSLRARALAQGGSLLLVEGAMGVLDAAADGRGSAADLACILGLPVVLIQDAAKQGQSAVLPAVALRHMRPDVTVAGVILNRVGSKRHLDLARSPFDEAGIPVFGALHRTEALTLPERHLGLVQAGETANLNTFLDGLASEVASSIDLEALALAAVPLAPTKTQVRTLPPLGQRIAVAQDAAFSFIYPHVLNDWRAAGAEVLLFSPLDNASPASTADAIYLPGGYPELHAGRLAQAEGFHQGLRHAAERGARVYGECGGYMVLGRALIDGDGVAHQMTGLLPLVSSFATRQLTLGYRRLVPQAAAPWHGELAGHEFHYATVVEEGAAAPLFQATDAAGTRRPDMGLQSGKVAGSFAHVIAPA
ncbi:MAG: cobyrinate a,c-diamide synthase [Pseudomonadota bacterium]